MPNMSNWISSGLRDQVFRTKTWAKPGTIAVALSSGTPNPTFTGSSMLEWQNANGYARQNVGTGDIVWSADDNLNGYTYNNQAITFPICTPNDGGWTSGICLVDNATYGVGNIIVWGSSVVAKYFQLNDQVVIPVSGLSFQFR